MALPQAITLVLDDYHLIGSNTVHEAIAFLLEYLPDNAHLVIACRTDPPLPLAKLRARNQITDLCAAELRFTAEEATVFLGDVMGLTLSAKDVAALDEVTEGWIATLQLAALSMHLFAVHSAAALQDMSNACYHHIEQGLCERGMYYKGEKTHAHNHLY